MSELGNATELGPTGETGIEPSTTIPVVAGVASIVLSAASDMAFDIVLIANTALTTTGEQEDQVMNIRIEHTAGPWTLSLNGSALTLNATAGTVEYLTCKNKGGDWECQEGVAVDVTA